MRLLTPFRCATYLLLILFTGHTAGGMLSQGRISPEADAVFSSMKSVHFVFNGSTATWYGFWFGFGLVVSVFLVFSAVVAWQLDRATTSTWPAVSTVAWALVASQVANAFLSFCYFFAGPGLLATAITVFLAIGSVQKSRLRG
jgi:hypothetical protein